MRQLLLLIIICINLRGAFAAEGVDFIRLKPPHDGDWRSIFVEPIQSFEEFVKTTPKAKSFEGRIIEILPLELDINRDAALLNELHEFLSLFFMTRVVFLKDKKISSIVKRRPTKGYGVQMLAEELIISSAKSRTPKLLAMLALTSKDLFARYDSGYLDFLFGLGSYKYRTAVVSEARLSMQFYEPSINTSRRRRLLKIAAHEVTHVLNLAHCQKYKCLMNGVNSLCELDETPMHLCPDCSQKLMYQLGYDAGVRFSGLSKFYKKIGWHRHSAFTRQRAKYHKEILLRQSKVKAQKP